MLTERLAEIRARLEKATPGKWEWSGDDLIQSACGESVLDIWPRMDEGKLEIKLDITPYDRDLIAHAPADLRFLLRVVEAVRVMEEQDPYNYEALPILDAYRAYREGKAE